jgi:hypothetical protein
MQSGEGRILALHFVWMKLSRREGFSLTALGSSFESISTLNIVILPI